MRMTYTSFMQFYENVDMSMLWSIWSPWRNKKGATAAKQKWCHGNISFPVAHGDTGAKEVGVNESSKDGGVLPDSGFPWVGGMAKEGHRKDDSFTEHTMHLIQHMH